MDEIKSYMTNEELRKMQLIQLEMLYEVDRVCKKHNIKYCIIAGTLLGAVRHGGYIPWDDDADIGMLREEYNRFCKVCKKELDESKFYFQNHENTLGYRWGYGKLRRKETKFIRKGQEHMPYESGVFIDIFPLDEVPNNRILRRGYDILCTIVRKTLWSSVGMKNEKNIIIRTIYNVLSWIPLNYVFGVYEVLKKMGAKKESSWVRILTFPTPNNNKWGYKKIWYKDLADIEFEGYSFPAPRNYEEYLEFKFGDYRELPPISERKVHIASYYNLDVEITLNDTQKRSD